MPHIDKLFDSRWLKAGQLDGDTTLTITRIDREQIEEEQYRPVVYFAEVKVGMVLNKTNARKIAGMYGPDTDAWIGHKVTLYATECDMAGETVPCIRVRAKVPA